MAELKQELNPDSYTKLLAILGALREETKKENLYIDENDLPRLMKLVEKGIDKEAIKEVIASSQKVSEKEKETKRIRQLPAGKLIEATKKDDECLTLVLECPNCQNVETTEIYEALELYGIGEYLGLSCECIKCKKEYRIGLKQIFKALAESNIKEYE
jgi:hypothetical protein